MDPALLVGLTAASVVLAEAGRAVLATALGDQTPRRAGRLGALHRNLDMVGAVLVPALLALSAGVAFGWGARVPTARGDDGPALAPWAAVAPALVHAVLAAGGTLLPAAFGDAVVLVNALSCGFHLLPAPPLAGGLVVSLLLRGDARARWDGWARSSFAAYGVVAAALLALVVTRG